MLMLLLKAVASERLIDWQMLQNFVPPAQQEVRLCCAASHARQWSQRWEQGCPRSCGSVCMRIAGHSVMVQVLR